MPDVSVPQISYTSREFSTILADLQEHVSATRPEDATDFFDANLGTLLLELLAYVGDLLSYGQDIFAQEVFLAVARRYESALRAANSVGYVPRSARAAQVVVTAATLPASVTTFGGTIRAGAFLTGVNNLRYEVTEDTTIVPGSSSTQINLKEGESFSETFNPTKQPDQSFTVSRGVVEDASWDVFVGDPTNPLNEWTQVSPIAFETSPTQTYEVRLDGEGRLTVKFGDGTAGKIPNDEITIRYRTTNGAPGNAAANTIQGAMQAEVIGTGTTAAISFRNTDQPATGGQDRESVAELRNSIPAFIRTLDKVITVADYEEAVAAQGGVRLAFVDVPIANFNGNVARVHVWDTEQFNFVAQTVSQGLTSVVSYQRYVQVPTSRVYDVQRYLRPRTIATVHNVVIRPTIAQVDLELGQVRYDTRNAAEDVHQGITQALVDLFEESSGFLIRISDIYNVVNSVPGVLGFTLERVLFEHVDFDDPTQPDVIDEYRTDQDPTGAAGGPFDPLQDIEIPAATQRAFYDDAFLYNNEIDFDSEIDSTTLQAINLRSLDLTLIAG